MDDYAAGLVSCAVWPTAVARALTMKSENAVKTQYKLASITFMIRFLIQIFLELCACLHGTKCPSNAIIYGLLHGLVIVSCQYIWLKSFQQEF